MKIAWYTPYSKDSTTGHFSETIIDSLVAASHQVYLIRSEYQGKLRNLSCRDTRATQIVWAEDIDAELISFLAGFDLLFFNIGNNFHDFAWAIPHQRQCPGITIMQDSSLHTLLTDWANINLDPYNQPYETVLANECGIEACIEFKKHLQQGDLSHWFTEGSQKKKVLSFAIPNTLGIVTHSHFDAANCSRSTGVPVATLPPIACSPTLRSENITSPSANEYVTKLLKFSAHIEKERSVLELMARMTSHMHPLASEMSPYWLTELAQQLDKLFPQSQLRSDDSLKLRPIDFSTMLNASFKEKIEKELGVPAFYCHDWKPIHWEPVYLELTNCHQVEKIGEKNCFWTQGCSQIDFTFERSCSVGWIWIELVDTGPIGKPLTVKIQDQITVKTVRKRRRWIRVKLPRQGDISQLSLTLETIPFQPSQFIPSSKDDRELGIAIGSIYFAQHWWQFLPRLNRIFS